jgi:dihydrofolate reductase
MPGKVLWHVTMSLDGFIAGPDDAMDWVFEITDHSPMGDEVIATAGAILAGRRMHDGMPQPGAEPYGGAWSGPIFILTHRPGTDDPTVRFLSDDLPTAVATALAAAEGKNLVLFGASIARQCLQQGLVDEILIHLVPVLLGDGVRLFDVPDGERIYLERIGCAESGQITDLRFRPTQSARHS